MRRPLCACSALRLVVVRPRLLRVLVRLLLLVVLRVVCSFRALLLLVRLRWRRVRWRCVAFGFLVLRVRGRRSLRLLRVVARVWCLCLRALFLRFLFRPLLCWLLLAFGFAPLLLLRLFSSSFRVFFAALGVAFLAAPFLAFVFCG